MSRYEPLLHYESLLHYKLQQRFLIFNRFTSKILSLLSLFFVSYVQHSHLAFKYLKSTIIHGFHFNKVPGFKVLEDSNQKTQKLLERSFSFFLKLMEGESPPSSNPPYQHQTKARGPIPQPRSWPNTEEDLRPNTCLKSGRAQMAKILQGSHCMAFLLTVRNGRERPIKSTLMAHSRHNQSGLQTPSTQARNQKLDWET